MTDVEQGFIGIFALIAVVVGVIGVGVLGMKRQRGEDLSRKGEWMLLGSAGLLILGLVSFMVLAS